MKLARRQLDLRARELLGAPYRALDPEQRRVIRQLVRRGLVARNIVSDPLRQPTGGERLADAVARIGGSWAFVIGFLLFLFAWVGLNGFVLLRAGGGPIDPYPYVFLNLILSMLAALQAPIIMMSQNRQAQKDREAAENDYAVNLKAELEIMRLHEKLETLRTREIADLMAHQIELLQELRERPRSTAA